MIRPLALVLLLIGCSEPGLLHDSAPPVVPFRACRALPPPLPPLRTPEAVVDRLAVVEALYRDCAERLRRVVASIESRKQK